MELNIFQREHREWLVAQFPNQTAVFPAAGLVEEAGELMHALLKHQQTTVWGEESRYKSVPWSDKMCDAAGDCAIYACSLCNTLNWDYKELVSSAIALVSMFDEVNAFEAVADLVRRGCKVVAAPSKREPLLLYTARLLSICHLWGMDFNRTLEVTWQKVKVRRRDATL